MAYGQPEANDDDASRMEWAEVQLLAGTVEKLLGIKVLLKPDERRFVEGLDTSLVVLRRHPGPEAVTRLKNIAWKHRRQMPKGAGPKLPPHDPIVMEMEGRA